MVFSASLSYRSLWTPANISAALWLDAADSSTLYDATSGGGLVASDGAIARWEDKSGNGYHFTQGTSSSRPLRKVAQQNGLDVVQFDGSDDFMLNSYEFLNSSSAVGNIFVVCRQITGTDKTFVSTREIGGVNGWLFRFNSTTELRYSHPGYTVADRTITDQVNLFEIIRDGLDVDLGDNGSFSSTSTLSGYTAAGVGTCIGASQEGTNRFLNSSLCEIIFTEFLLSTASREKVEGYLAHKWGLTANLPTNHPYKNNLPRGL